MMHLKQLTKIVRPLSCQFKSVLNCCDLFASKNLSIRCVSKKAFGKLPDEPFDKRSSELTLKLDPRTKQLSLQLGDTLLDSSSSKSGGTFCTFCNSEICRLNASENDDGNDKLEQNIPATIKIMISRKEFCKAFCDGLVTSSNGNTGGSKYCIYCKEICKNPQKGAEGTDSKYCDVCKTTECEFANPNQSKMITSPEKSKNVEEKSKNVEKKSTYCRYCEADKCKFPKSSKSVGDGTVAKLSEGRGKDKSTKRTKSADQDKETGPQYCTECKQSVCKYVTTSTKTTKDLEKLTGPSQSSDDLSITMNVRDICGTICKGEVKNALTAPNSTSPSRKDTKDKTPRRKDFNFNYDADNSNN